MWVEAVLLAEDLDHIVGQFAPMTIALGTGHLLLTDPAPSVLVPEVGLRIMCKGKAHWPVLGVEVPVTIQSLTVLLRLEIARGDQGGMLVFKLEIEAVDLAGIPKMFDHRIAEMANAEIVRKQVELSWGFARTLTHSFRLPRSLEPLDSFDLNVLAGRVTILSSGIGLAVKLDSAVKRHGVEPTPAVG